MQRLVWLLVLGLGLGLGCERKRGEIHGVGDYVIGETMLKQSGGVCQPHRAQTWCTGLSNLKIGEQSASADLYFGGHEPGSTLVEILLGIRRCNVASARSALEHQLGKPDEVLDKRVVWTFKKTVIVARLPVDNSPTDCEVSFVHPGETRTIEYLKTGVMPPKEGAAPAGKSKAE